MSAHALIHSPLVWLVLFLSPATLVSCGRVNFEAVDAGTDAGANQDGSSMDANTNLDASATDGSSEDASVDDAETDSATLASCDDGILNQDETNVDCGGRCPACPATFDCPAVVTIPQAECEALVALYNSAGGDGWTDNGDWLIAADPCSWAGVTCVAGHVDQLYFTGNTMNGSLPPEVGNLTEMTKLWLIDSGLTGSLPAEIGSLTNLSSVLLSGNQLQGSIPAELGNLSNLLTLWLDGNQLSGTLPPSLGGLGAITAFLLNDNQLRGSIPAELGSFTNCTTFNLHNNQLSGTVPPSLMSIPSSDSFTLYGQAGCLSANGNATLEGWLNSRDPNWNDGCP